MGFTTPIEVTGPFRAPVQLLGEQEYGGHASVHDEATARSLDLAGAPIEGPTHFSQFDPLAHALWGRRWFESGCISSHFESMVVEGQEVRAVLSPSGPGAATIRAERPDGGTVLRGTASVGGDAGPTALAARRATQRPPEDLRILDRLVVGAEAEPVVVRLTMDEPNGALYPFSLRRKLDVITEPHPWYESADTPWGAPVVPIEMISVLAHRVDPGWPVRTPSLGLFLDLEIELVAGPVLVDRDYRLTRRLVQLGSSRRTESHWTESVLADPDSGAVVARVLLHAGVFRDSYPG